MAMADVKAEVGAAGGGIRMDGIEGTKRLAMTRRLLTGAHEGINDLT